MIWNEHCFFLCQEYANKHSLSKLLKRSTMWEEVIAAIIYQVIVGMEFLDEHGLKHRGKSSSLKGSVWVDLTA